MTEFQSAVFRWYRRTGRTLPWRGERDPYRILVSEVMLQQTQVSRVLEKYSAFLAQFPTLHSLARAPRSHVIRMWRGMGYNNRAVRLHRLAHTVVHASGGILPHTEKELMDLPGIGRYTARAIMNSAFALPVPVVDVNIQRFFSRVFWSMRNLTDMRPLRDVEAHALKQFPPRKGYEWNQALMDLGATVCTARTPQCDACPVALQCRSRTGMKRVTATRKKSEPSFYGVPERIHRGHIIEHLRGLRNGYSLPLAQLGKAVLPHFSNRNMKWLRRILGQLERDGLVRVQDDGTSLMVRLA